MDKEELKQLKLLLDKYIEWDEARDKAADKAGEYYDRIFWLAAPCYECGGVLDVLKRLDEDIAAKE